jgi:hypothetical protein
MDTAPQGSGFRRLSAADLPRNGDHNNRRPEEWFLFARHSFTRHVRALNFSVICLPQGRGLIGNCSPLRFLGATCAICHDNEQRQAEAH